MTEGEFLDRVEVWALGGLSDLERAQMERFMAAAPSAACVDAHRRAVEAAAVLAASLPPSPPAAGGWDRLAAALPVKQAGSSSRPPSAKTRVTRAWIVALAVAAAALLLLWRDRARHVEHEARLEAQVRAQRAQLDGQAPLLVAAAQFDSCKAELTRLQAKDALAAEAVALLELPGTQLIPLDRPGPGTTPTTPSSMAANAIYHRGVKRAYVVAAGIPDDAPADGYQVWLVRDGKRIAAGTLLPDHGRAIAVVPTLTLDDGVPETFQLALASGQVILESQIRI